MIHKAILTTLPKLTAVVWIGLIGWFGTMAYDNYVSSFTQVVDASMVPPNPKAGDNVQVNYQVFRRKQNCDLIINRYIEDKDGKEFYIQLEHRNDIGDNKLHNTEFNITIPKFLPPGHYELVSRVQYYCNALDYIIPRIKPQIKLGFDIEN